MESICAKNKVFVFILAVGFLCSLLFWRPAAAKLYKWVDENGVTHYSQTPPPESDDVKIKTFSEFADSEYFDVPVLYLPSIAEISKKQHQKVLESTRSKSPSGYIPWFYLVERNSSTPRAWGLTVNAYFKPDQTSERIRKGKILRLNTRVTQCRNCNIETPEEWPAKALNWKYCQVVRPGKSFDDVSVIPTVDKRPMHLYSGGILSDAAILTIVDTVRNKMQPRDHRIRYISLSGSTTGETGKIPYHVILSTDDKSYGMYFNDGKWSDKMVFKKSGKRK